MAGRTFTLRRSAGLADEVFQSIPDAAARLVALADGVPVIVRPATLSNGDAPRECLAVHRLDRRLPALPAIASGIDARTGRELAGPATGEHFETVAYVLARPITGDDQRLLSEAYDVARDKQKAAA